MFRTTATVQSSPSRSTFKRETRWVSLAAVLTSVIITVTAHSNEITNHGFTSRGISLSGAVTADVKDISALYYNPAGIGGVETEASLNLLLTTNFLHIDLYDRLEGAGSADVPSNVYDLPLPAEGAAGYPVATGDLINERTGVENNDVGFTMTLGLTLALSKKLKMAVAAFIPVASAPKTTMYPDGREQHFSGSLRFSVLESKAPGPLIMLGAGSELAKWIRLGATLIMFQQRTQQFQVFLSNPQGAETDALMQKVTDKSLAASFNAGLQIDFANWLSMGIAYRHKLTSEEEIASKAEVYNYSGDNPPSGEMRYDKVYTFVHDFNPSELALGLRWGKHCPWALYTDVVWRMWSQYDDADDGTKGQEFHDVVIPRVGFEYEVRGWWDIRFGLEYAINPVHDQNSDTNHVDNDRILGSVGVRFELPWPEKAQLDLHAQILGLIPRTTEKEYEKMTDEYPVVTNEETGETFGDELMQTNNPGYPGYESGGVMLSFGTAITIPF